MRASSRTALCALLLSAVLWAAPLSRVGATSSVVQAVDAVGMTVSDIDRSVAFFTDVLTFEKTSDIELAGSEYERLQGVFGLRMRVVRMRLGDEQIELTQYLTPQ